MNLQEALFSGWSGCSNGDCVVRDNSKGMHTNASCKCVVEANRAQLYVLQSRLNRLVRQPAPDVAELVEALEETQRDLTVLLGNIFASSKRDKNWEGMYDVVNGWIARNHAALAKHGGAA